MGIALIAPSWVPVPDSGGGYSPSDGPMNLSEIVIPHPGRLALRGIPQIVEASVVPAVVFFVVLHLAGPSWALAGCLLWSYAAITRRAIMGRRLPAILVIGAALVTLRTMVGLLTGSVFFYFLQPVLGSVFLAVAFAVSVACGRPLLIRLIRDFCPLAPEVTESAPVRSILSRLTLAWAGVHLLNAALTGALLFAAPLGIFLILKVVGVYLITGLAVVGSLLWGRRAGLAYGITLRFEPRPLIAPAWRRPVLRQLQPVGGAFGLVLVEALACGRTRPNENGRRHED